MSELGAALPTVPIIHTGSCTRDTAIHGREQIMKKGRLNIPGALIGNASHVISVRWNFIL